MLACLTGFIASLSPSLQAEPVRGSSADPERPALANALELVPGPPVRLVIGETDTPIAHRCGTSPAVMDLNGDGWDDLLLGQSNGSPIQVHYGSKNGLSEPRSLDRGNQSLNVPGRGDTLQVVDLDWDGLPDLLCGSGEQGNDRPGYMFVARGTATAFEPMEVLCSSDRNPLTVRVDRRSFVPSGNCTRPFAGDLDGDGDLDLVVGDLDGSFTFIPFEQGGFAATGQLLGPTNFRVNGHSDPFLIDLDGDGDLDLVSGCANGGVYRSENLGDERTPKFESLEEWIAPPPRRIVDCPKPELGSYWLTGPQRHTRVCLGDVDGDGVTDLLVADEYKVRSARPGFSPAAASAELEPLVQPWAEQMASWPDAETPERDTALGEWNTGMETLEHSLNRTSQISQGGGVWLYRGRLPKVEPEDAPKPPSGSEVKGPKGGGDTLAVDKLRAVSVPASPKKARIALSPVQVSKPVRLQAQGEWIEAAGAGKANPELFDLDGDGYLDLLVADGEGRIAIHRGGMAGFEPGVPLDGEEAPLVHPEDPGECGASLQVVDLDGDGREDLLVGGLGVQGIDAPRSIYWLRGRGGMRFDDYREVLDLAGNPLRILGSSLAPFAADLNSDGHLDLVVGTKAGQFKLYRGTPQGFEAEGELLTSPSSEDKEPEPLKLFGGGASPRLADVDNDGDLDLLSGSKLTGLYIAKNQGTSERPRFARMVQLYDLHTFKRERSDIVNSESVAHPGVRARLCWGDVTGDGVPDLLVGDSVLVRDTGGHPPPRPTAEPRRTGYLWLFVGSPWVNQTGKRPTAKPRR